MKKQLRFFRRIGSASSKRANFLQEKAKAQLIVAYLLTSILTHYCGKFAFLNRMGFESVMPKGGKPLRCAKSLQDSETGL